MFVKTGIRHLLQVCLGLTFFLVSTNSASAQGLLRDTEIEEILEEYTTPILRAAGLSPQSVDIYLVNDPSLNAFVTRGQNIFLHSGLILASDTPNQLKGVIAHEAGHIADGRLARSDYQNRSAYKAVILSVGLGLAAALAGSPDVGAIVALGGSQQYATLEILSHTRIGESVADQYAANYLETTGQSGKGLIQFFEKFRYQELLSYARRFPYFRSHPLSSERIDSLREVVAESPYTEIVDSESDLKTLAMMKAKLRGFLEDPQLVFSRYPETDQSDEARYARSVAYFKSADLKNAIREIDTLIELYPENPYFHELKAQILYESGRGIESLPSIKEARRLQPNEPLLQIANAQALIEQGDKTSLVESEDLLKSALLREPRNATAWYFLGQTYGRLGQDSLAKYATAEQRYALGDLQSARSFAERAQEGLPRNEPQWRRAGDIIAISNIELSKKKHNRHRPKP